MSYNDEFEDLIKNFKLDDIEKPPAAQVRQPVPSRSAPPQNTAVSRAPQSAPQQSASAQQPRRQEARRPMAQEPPREPVRQPELPRSNAPAQATNRRGAFRVNIDDSKFYTQGALPPRGPGDGQTPHGPDDDDDDEHQDGFLSGLGRWTKAFLVLAIALGVSAFLAYFVLMSAVDLFGLNKEDRELTFTLPENLVISQVASLLKEKGVISQPLTFQLYATIKEKSDDFIPGTYELNSNMSYDQIITRFSTLQIKLVEKQLTFYEGMTMREIAELLEKESICKAEDFYAFLEQSELPWTFEFLKGVPDTKERYRRMEGYLFPDTYTFNEGESVDTVVQKFLVNFNNKFDEDLKKKISDSGMTIDEVVTLASVIQKEVSSDTDMRRVSSVFHNRLKSTQLNKLQSDVTVFYVENDLKPFLGGVRGKKVENDPNQNIYDAYNTYTQVGLPVGPICNPGKEAILAALEPADTAYYYFVADKNGQTYYAETQAEHDTNVANVLTLGDAHGVGTGIGPQEETQDASSAPDTAGAASSGQ